MKSIDEFFLWADVHALLCVKAVRDWLLEWFSLSRKHFERGLLILYCLSAEISLIGGFSDTWLNRFSFALPLFVICCAWRGTNSTDQHRWLQLKDSRYFYVRTAVSILFTEFLITIIFARKPHHWFDGFTALALITLWASIYAACLPGSGQSGRRRKAALAKLRSWFGSSWVPAPQPQGS